MQPTEMSPEGSPPEIESVRSTLVKNEQAKLTATYVNGLAIAVFAVGGLAPIFGVLYADKPLGTSAWTVVPISLICWAASAALHYSARRMLEELKQ